MRVGKGQLWLRAAIRWGTVVWLAVILIPFVGCSPRTKGASRSAATTRPAKQTAPATPKAHQLARIKTVAPEEDRRVFTIGGAPEVAVGGDVIASVSIGKTSAVVSYFNKTAASLAPAHTFRLINGYGFELCRFDAKWLLSSVHSAEARSEEIDWRPARFDELLEFSDVAVPDDWQTPVFLVIEGDDTL